MSFRELLTCPISGCQDLSSLRLLGFYVISAFLKIVQKTIFLRKLDDNGKELREGIKDR